MSFPERLKELRMVKNVPKIEITRSVGIDSATYFRYEKGQVEPSISKLAAFADYFNVSADYLLGRTDNPKVCR